MFAYGPMAFADVTMTCPEIAMNMFVAPLQLVQDHVPSGQKDNLAGPDGKAVIQVTSASDCSIVVDGEASGLADFVRILARHKDDPDVGEAGDGMYVPISAYTNNHTFAKNASHAFEYRKEVAVEFSGETTRTASATIPGVGKIVSSFGEFVEEGGIPLAAKDFYLLRNEEKSGIPDLKCGGNEVGVLASAPNPKNSVNYAGTHPVLTAAIAVATLKVDNIQCVYLHKQ